MKILLLGVLWIMWSALHSGMISRTATAYFKRRLGSRFCIYRLVFNLVALATLIPIVLFEQSLKGPLLFRWEGYLVVFQMILMASIVVLFFAGARHYDLLQFLGLRQIKTGSSHSVLTESGHLDTTGILEITRHPWYLGAILLIWTRNLDPASLVTNLILTLYLLVGTILEERKLLIEYGEDYRRYQKSVSMLVPVKWLMSAARNVFFSAKGR